MSRLIAPFSVSLLWLFLALPAGLLAQRAYWEPNHGTLGFAKTSELNLVFENCAPENDVTLPAVTNLEFGRPSISQQTSINFGQTTSRVVLSYPVQPKSRDEVVIPSFDVRTNRGKIAVGEVRFTVGDATVGQSGLNVSDILKAQLQPGRSTVWAGDVFDVEYLLLASPRFRASIASNPEWKPTGVVFEPFGDFEQIETVLNGERRVGARYRTRAIATEAGPLQLASVQQTVNVQTGERSGFFLSQPQVESFTIASDQPHLTVRPLPGPAPEGFTGAIGDFTLESKIVPETARIGEPITWTVTLRGTGNWPSNPRLPEREISADFQVVQPQGRQTMDDGRLFSGSLTEDAVLVPTRAGTYQIGPIKFAWFDTRSGQFRQEPVPAVTVTIQPAAPQPETTTTPAPGRLAPGQDAPRGDEIVLELPPDLEAPLQLPRDPIDGSDPSMAPRGLGWWWWLPLALGIPALFWVALAWRAMWRSDPRVARVQAQRGLLRLLAPWTKSNATPDANVLLRWRELTAALWSLDRAAPTVENLAHALESRGGAPRPDDWLQLWREAEQALFAADGALPRDWAARAWQAAGTVRVRRAAPPVPIRAGFWVPGATAVLLVCLLAITPGSLAAADRGIGAYNEGDFAAARAIWQVQVTNAPRDWIKRNNLALACAQQDDWAEAAAHWTAAFLLNPREPSVRANLRLALTHLDGVDPELRRLVEGSWLDRAATALSPAEWQLTYFVGAGIVAAGLILLISSLYWPLARKRRSRIGYTLVVLGVLASIAGFAANAVYGPLAGPDAGLVTQPTELCSIPTDLAESQQSAPLSAGAVVITHREFLGWTRVDIARTAGGWLRRETIVPFFQAPPAKAESTSRTPAETL